MAVKKKIKKITSSSAYKKGLIALGGNQFLALLNVLSNDKLRTLIMPKVPAVGSFVSLGNFVADKVVKKKTKKRKAVKRGNKKA